KTQRTQSQALGQTLALFVFMGLRDLAAKWKRKSHLARQLAHRQPTKRIAGPNFLRVQRSERQPVRFHKWQVIGELPWPSPQLVSHPACEREYTAFHRYSLSG